MSDNILNAILENENQAPAAPVVDDTALNGAHSFTRGTTITEAGRRHVERVAELAAGSYRGLGTDVSDLGNDAPAIMRAAGLNWKTIPMPLAIQGRHEFRPFPGMVALVRGDNGYPLAVATDSYKPHHNEQLIGTMARFANEAGLTLARVGTFNGGSRGWAIATSGVSAEAKVGDVIAMHIVMKFGHAPGTATSIMAFAHELRCSNGACIEVGRGKARFVHSAELSATRISTAREFVRAAAGAFGQHMDKLILLRQTPSTAALDLMQLAELYQPELAGRMAERLQGITNLNPETDNYETYRSLGRRVIAACLERDDSRRLVAGMIYHHGDRLLKQVVDATLHQPGADATVNTMAHAYSGVTNFNSNVRGRQAITGLEANLFGTAAQNSTDALNLAMAVTERVRAIQ